MSANIEIYRELYNFWKAEHTAYLDELKVLMKALSDVSEQIVKNIILCAVHDIIVKRNDCTEKMDYYQNLIKMET